MNPILSLKLVNTATRPIYVYQIGRIEVKALFDTGAATPVWCTGEKILKEAYPDFEKIAKQMNYVSEEDLFAALGYGETTLNKVVFGYLPLVFVVPRFIWVLNAYRRLILKIITYTNNVGY